MARATSSLPVPLSPRISTVTSWPAARPIALYTSCIAGDRPTIRSAAASSGSSSSANRAGTCVRRLCSMALARTSRSWRRSSGLSRYSKAPRFIASMAVSVAANAVITITGRRGSISADLVEGVQARHVGQPHVEDHGVGPSRADALDPLPGRACGEHARASRTSGSPRARRAHWARRPPPAAVDMVVTGSPPSRRPSSVAL